MNIADAKVVEELRQDPLFEKMRIGYGKVSREARAS
jgi:hypothetical protein